MGRSPRALIIAHVRHLRLWPALLLCLWTAAPLRAAEETVWDALRALGSVVVVRHSYAPGTFDPPDAKLEDCSTQRNLDDSGRAQARRIGVRRRQLVEIRKAIA